MKVVLVNGSPHNKGCTYTALCEVANTLNEEGIETEIFWIGSRPLGGCIACRACAKTGECVYRDVVNTFRNNSSGIIRLRRPDIFRVPSEILPKKQTVLFSELPFITEQ